MNVYQKLLYVIMNVYQNFNIHDKYKWVNTKKNIYQVSCLFSSDFTNNFP